MRSYHFADTNEDLQYALFVSSTVKKDKKAPLIVTLHGLGAGPQIMLGTKAVDLAEEGGYILVGPAGYNNHGWYGIDMKGFGPPPRPANAAADNAGAAPPRAMPPGIFGDPSKDPPNLSELSEKDVMNVLAIVRKEFNVDDRRIYLMGHSMGGAGTIYLGVKYGSIWAALAPIASAAFTVDPDTLKNIKDMPILFVHGDADTVVPVAVTRRFVDKAKALNMPNYEYKELPGVDHGPVITAALPDIYAFFDKHSKPAAK
jgi:predicted peptidase